LAGDPYDYIAALAVIGVVFVSAVLVIPSMNYVSLLQVDQQQLRNVAEQIFKTMLLEPGYPSDWGLADPFDQDSVDRIGLASENSTLYVLDSDKVQRLVTDNPIGYVEYDKTRELLGLEGYGFSLSIVPPFNATVENNQFEVTPSRIDLKLEVTVLYVDGGPVPNAAVESTIIYTTKKGENSAFYAIVERGSTDPLGVCIAEKHMNAPSGEQFSDIIVVFRVSVASVASMLAVYQRVPPNNIANINYAGDNIILTVPEITPRGARWVDNIIEFDWESFVSMYNGTRSNDDKLTYGEGYKVWSRTFRGLKHGVPSLLIMGFWAVEESEGRRCILIAGPNPNWFGSRVLQYGDPERAKGANCVVKLQRNVVISGMTYLAEMMVWKES